LKLLGLHVENFGTLQNFDLTPDQGLNVLYQKNGWGKSTLAVFIKAMFYGLPATTRRSLDENERKKYMPWQGGAYGGSLDFSVANGSFRVERFFGAKESADTFALFDLATNKPSTAYSSALGEELFGIDADGFERSTYLSQRILGGSRDNNSISAKLGNLLDDVGDIGNYDDAMAVLEKRRKHYVLTGNRGAVAALEQDLISTQAELERVRSIEFALNAQEEQLTACTDELAATRKTAEETRVRLEAAGLARERAALAEQKKTMERDLEALKARYRQTDRFFRGATPTVEEWRSYCELYESLKEATAQRNFFASTPQSIDRIKEMRKTFEKGVPTETILSRMTRDADALHDMRSRSRALREILENDAPLQRFPDGAPSDASLDEMKDRLQRVAKLQKEIHALPSDGSAKHRIPQLSVGILGGALGLLFLILAVLPAMASAMIPLLIIGGILFVGGGTMLAIGLNKRGVYLRMLEEAANKRALWTRSIADELRTVCTFLKENRMPTDDPTGALTELCLLAAQYREAIRQRARTAEELHSIEAQRATVSERLRSGLSRYLGELPEKEDYRSDLDILRREVHAYLQLENTEKQRLDDCSAATHRIAELKNELQPFLDKYDPLGTMTPGDCLQLIGEQRAERSRLSREIAQKEAALERFVAEKKITEEIDEVSCADYDALRAEEALLQQKIDGLQAKCATLKSSIERLSIETDRIPELETRVLQLNEQFSEAKANSATVANAQKFMEEAKTALSTRYLDGMQTAFRHYLDILTDGQAPEAIMDTSFSVSLREGGKTRAMESFSRGWRDAVEFCTRLSLTSALFKDSEKPFLLLDDPFVNLDDNRLDAAKAMLEKLADEYQIFYFVCHKERI